MIPINRLSTFHKVPKYYNVRRTVLNMASNPGATPGKILLYFYYETQALLLASFLKYDYNNNNNIDYVG